MRSASLLSTFDPRRRWLGPPRTVTLSRRAVIAGCVGLVLLSGWSGASLLYFVSRDDLALTSLEKQAALKRDYEARIGALRAQMEKSARQRLSEAERLETRLSELLARQAAFEARQNLVRTLADRAGIEEPDLPEAGMTGSVEVTSPSSGHAYAPEPKPASRGIFELRLRPPEPKPDRTSGSLDDRFRTAGSNLASLEKRQVQVLGTIVQAVEEEEFLLQAALRSVGLDLQTDRPAEQNTGGPLVQADGPKDMFLTLASHAETGIGRLRSLRRTVATLPLGEPIQGEIDFSSGFGYRIDPFTRSPALHTGLDFRAEAGSPVRAAGAGRVVMAEYSGAYGNMVEIDHGQGITSRYAHLSTISVLVGQPVEPGTLLGQVGSTGRSTGPHLHYETRILGDAVNPQRFLRAGARITAFISASR